ncbi:MAG: hypothetical protein AAF411_16025 [Myxococcota bacterium]
MCLLLVFLVEDFFVDDFFAAEVLVVVVVADFLVPRAFLRVVDEAGFAFFEPLAFRRVLAMSIPAPRGTLLLALLLLGCGASPRMLHQSSVFYEQCRAAELNSQLGVDQRRECWAAWLKYYAAGQPIERVGYAQDRRIALAYGDELAPLPDRQDPSWELASRPPDDADSADAADDVPADENAATEPSAEPDADSQASDISSADFRQDPGAPPGRHFPVRQLPPAEDPPLPGPPRGSTRSACASVCDPAWDGCVRACVELERACVHACEARHRRCEAACP